jgi:hypothetical protein
MGGLSPSGGTRLRGASRTAASNSATAVRLQQAFVPMNAAAPLPYLVTADRGRLEDDARFGDCGFIVSRIEMLGAEYVTA